MNTHYVKISGNQFELNGSLDQTKHQTFQGAGQVVKITKYDEQGDKDGHAYRFVYTIKPKFLDVRESDTEVSLPEKKIKRHVSSSMTMSQELRFWLQKEYEQLEGTLDMTVEEYYKREMRKLITKVQANVQMLEEGE